MQPLDPSGTALAGLLLRLGLACLSGGVIGWERHASGKPAGLRTHMLVTVGSAVFVMAALDDSAASASRVVQGIAAGIGFLGAGEIRHLSREDRHDEKVKGLTSAAAIWVSAALGISAGYGLWRMTLLGSGVILFILTAARWVEDRIPKRRGRGEPPLSERPPR